MRGTATEGATQVRTFGIGRLSEKENVTMSTSLQVGPQVRMTAKGGPQGMVVGQNGTANFTGVVPVGAKFVTCLDFY